MSTPTLRSLLDESAYHDYVYSYPHKTAYRPLKPRRLSEVWEQEDKRRLFLYLHVPFCEMRCGFCNLFTTVTHQEETMAQYLDALERQARIVHEEIGNPQVSQMAIGGGTPTLLSERLLERLLGTASRYGVDAQLPMSVESSPETASLERLTLLHGFGVDRLSIGVQSFELDEVESLVRRQDSASVRRSLETIAGVGFETFNIDLMYGIDGQTSTSFTRSIDQAIAHGANELYLYPLYVRPLSGLGTRGDAAMDRLILFEAGRDHLISLGWTQHSMRRFTKSATDATVDHRCQQDGMIGLGVGARSYTETLQYSSEYAVRASEVRSILDTWCTEDDAFFAHVHHGIRLNLDERRRRYVILSLLDGALDRGNYRQRFGYDVLSDHPELYEACELELLEETPARLTLTQRGVTYSDTLGHWLFSPAVRELMGDYVLR